MELTAQIFSNPFFFISAIYVVSVNLVSLYLMRSDKRKAIKNKRRVPEKTLFLWAIAGGSIGSILGMKRYRHKTRHLSFILGMPLIFLVETTIATYALHTLFF